MKSFAVTLLIFNISFVQAANHQVLVGPSANLVFSPNQVVAGVGDAVEFVIDEVRASIREWS